MALRHSRWLLVCVFLFTAAAPASSQDSPDSLSNFAAASVEIGQKKFNAAGCDQSKKEGNAKPGKTKICSSEGSAAVHGTTLYLADSSNDRVLGYKKIPKKNDGAANFVLGQKNFTSNKEGTSSTLFNFPSALVTAGNQLLMTDFGNSRVLIWNTLPTKTNVPADVVVGQPNLTSSASATTQSGLDHPELGLFVAGGKLFVSDRNNNRIVIWNSIPTTNGANADVVVGQPNFTSKGANTTQDGFHEPEGIWSDGSRLVVADESNNRVLIWNTIPTTNGAPADLVIGQSDFTSSDKPEPPSAQSLDEPVDVTSDGTSLYVDDSENNRILVFSPFPTSDNPTASIVLGQSDFTHGGINAGSASPSAQTLDFPFGISVAGSQLFVNDTGNNRFLIFNL